MIRQTILVISALVLLGIMTLAVLVYRAAPASDSQVIRGVGIGAHDDSLGRAYLSGKRLDCVSEATAPYTDTCTVMIEGKALTIQVLMIESDTIAMETGSPILESGGCEATYNGQTWACTIASRHTGVERFAYIQEPLGLEMSQMDALRGKYYFENLPEELFFQSLYIIPLLVTLALVSGIAALWKRPFDARVALTLASVSFVVYFGNFLILFPLVFQFGD